MGAPADINLRFRGWMFGLAEVGADYAVLPRLALGPFVGLSVGRYNFGSDSDTPEQAPHLQEGARMGGVRRKRRLQS